MSPIFAGSVKNEGGFGGVVCFSGSTFFAVPNSRRLIGGTFGECGGMVGLYCDRRSIEGDGCMIGAVCFISDDFGG